MKNWLRARWCDLFHRGRVGYWNDTGPFWMCDTCGRVIGGNEEER